MAARACFRHMPDTIASSARLTNPKLLMKWMENAEQQLSINYLVMRSNSALRAGFQRLWPETLDCLEPTSSRSPRQEPFGDFRFEAVPQFGNSEIPVAALARSSASLDAWPRIVSPG